MSNEMGIRVADMHQLAPFEFWIKTAERKAQKIKVP